MKKIEKVGICGMGWVGKAMYSMFPDATCYDKYTRPTKDGKEVTLKDINACDVAFVCVPTNNLDRGDYYGKGKGALDCSIVEELVRDLTCDLIVIRSTVMPGTTDRLSAKYHKNLVMQPEYLGETVAHPLLDPKTRPFLIMGGKKEDTRRLIELYQKVYNANTSIRQVSALEAEVIKLSENRAIAFKVAQCQELYDACEKAGVDYYTIRDAVYGDDPRFNLWFTFVYPDKRGFQSKCIPKDIYGWSAWCKEMGFTPELTDALLKYNDKLLKSREENKIGGKRNES